jgi:iron complex outermembrane receptor protein
VAYQKIGQTFTDVARRGAPELKFNAGLRGEWDNGLNSEIAIHYVDAATYPVVDLFSTFARFGATVPNPTVDSYTLLNLRAGYRFWHDKAEVAVSVFNALNDEHREYPLGDIIGRRVMGWLTLRL